MDKLRRQKIGGIISHRRFAAVMPHTNSGVGAHCHPTRSGSPLARWGAMLNRSAIHLFDGCFARTASVGRPTGIRREAGEFIDLPGQHLSAPFRCKQQIWVR